jgi:leader peptidase (prepilin peptidase)/N-methyltransferase
VDFFPLLAHSPPLLAGAAILFGLCIGSFLNVVIYRLPKMLEREWRSQCEDFLGGATTGHPDTNATRLPKYNLLVPRSACPACGHKITALENVPLASYLVLKGRCSSCKAKIGIRYPLVELLAGLLSGYVAWRFGASQAALSALLFCWALIALTFIDADTQLLPDTITLPLLWFGLMVNTGNTFTDLGSAVWGAVLGYLVLWLVYWLFRIVTGKEGLGYGDFKLLAALGAWMGWQMLPLIILLSATVGAVIGLAGIMIAGREKGARIPFGPYLAAAGFAALLWGKSLNEWYLGGLAR